MADIKGLLFDLDGVIVDTAKYHFLAWRRMANELGFDFNEEQNEQLKGVSRRKSIERIIGWGNVSLTEDEINHFMAQKNEWYVAYIQDMTPAEMLPGVQDFLQTCRAKGYRIALGSASKNALAILDKLRITHLFDAIIDGNKTTKSKPDPQVFLLGAGALKLNPETCIVFEDAIAGIDAAHNGGMKAVGIGESKVLTKADVVYSGLNQIDIDELLQKLT